MEALNLINKWLYKHVSRNDLPIKDQNFTILCIEVIYSRSGKPVPNVKMLVNYCHFPMASVCTMVAHTHWTNYVSIFFFENQGITSNLSHDWNTSDYMHKFWKFHLTHNNEDPQNNFFLDKSQSKFLDISDYFLATPLKMLKYNFLSFHCFPEKFLYTLEIISIFAKILEIWKGFNLKKIGLQTYRHVIWKLFQSYNNWVIKRLTCIFYAL